MFDPLVSASSPTFPRASLTQLLMARSGPVSGATADVTYKVNVDPSQPAGTYTNTITYICTGNF